LLRLENPTANGYDFGSQGLADSVDSCKVVASAETASRWRRSTDRCAASSSSPAAVEWWFLPVRVGRFDDVMSTKTHTEAGMRATIEIR